jgi:hypothetical protein
MKEQKMKKEVAQKENTKDSTVVKNKAFKLPGCW